jgi:hypothetical protein
MPGRWWGPVFRLRQTTRHAFAKACRPSARPRREEACPPSAGSFFAPVTDPVDRPVPCGGNTGKHKRSITLTLAARMILLIPSGQLAVGVHCHCHTTKNSTTLDLAARLFQGGDRQQAATTSSIVTSIVSIRFCSVAVVATGSSIQSFI